MICFGVALLNEIAVDSYDPFNHILKGYFTGTGAIYDCPSASEVTLKDKGIINNKAKHNKP